MATFPTIQDLRGLPDPLLQYRWTLIVPNVPGGGDSQRLQYQCQTSSIPGMTTEEVLVPSHGNELRFAGRQTFGGTLSCTFYETRDLVIYTTFLNWLKFQRDQVAGSGNYKSNYATSAQLLLLDDQLNTINTVNFVGFFPGEVSESSLDGNSQAPVQFTVNFRYDYHYMS